MGVDPAGLDNLALCVQVIQSQEKHVNVRLDERKGNFPVHGPPSIQPYWFPHGPGLVRETQVFPMWTIDLDGFRVCSK